jgi:hypothetical protein
MSEKSQYGGARFKRIRGGIQAAATRINNKAAARRWADIVEASKTEPAELVERKILRIAKPWGLQRFERNPLFSTCDFPQALFELSAIKNTRFEIEQKLDHGEAIETPYCTYYLHERKVTQSTVYLVNRQKTAEASKVMNLMRQHR